MRTTLDIEKEVLDEVTRLTGERKKSKAVNEALKDYVRRKKLEKLVQLFGKVDIEEDWRKLRDGELGEER